MSLSNLESGTSISLMAKALTFIGTWQQIIGTWQQIIGTWQQSPHLIRTATSCLMVFQLLAQLLCRLLKIIYAPIAEVSVLEGVKIVMHLVDFISCLCRLMCPDTVCVG